MALVTAAVFVNGIQANIAMGMLRSNGIPCVITGDVVNQVLGIHMIGVDGIQLLVNEEDLPKALEALKECGDLKEE